MALSYFTVKLTLSGLYVVVVFHLTTESKWEKPEGFQGANPAPAQPGYMEV